MEALLFDCDGVLVDTERDGHRVAFNLAFAEKGLDISWTVEEYGELLKVAGGKERMKHYFDMKGWPSMGELDKAGFIRDLHGLKTAFFMQLIESGKLPLRPGVARIMDEAIREGIRMAVCSTSNVHAVTTIVDVLLGRERKKYIEGIYAGDMVARKKPDPAVYHLCTEKLKLDPIRCCVVEDSRNGLLAAKAAGYPCIITTNEYTEQEDFSEADAVYSGLGDDPALVGIEDLKKLIDKY